MTVKAKSFIPLKDKIFVTDLEHGFQKSSGGIILTDDNMQNYGIRPRWCKVSYKGKDVDYVDIGDWLLMPHGRWSHKISLEFEDGKVLDIWQIDPKDILLKSDSQPSDRTNIEVL